MAEVYKWVVVVCFVVGLGVYGMAVAIQELAVMNSSAEAYKWVVVVCFVVGLGVCGRWGATHLVR